MQIIDVSDYQDWLAANGITEAMYNEARNGKGPDEPELRSVPPAKKGVYTNSPLVEFTRSSPNNSGRRVYEITRITPHCVVGQCAIESLGALFAQSSVEASSNYGIDKDGRVGLFVDEANRSWCSSSYDNDERAVTIECASDAAEPYAMNQKVWDKLVELCADICRRNGKNTLLWLGDKDKTLAYQPKGTEMVLSAHRWFANKSCPGDWLYSRYGELARKVTEKLNGELTSPEPAPQIEAKPKTLYRVQTGAFSVRGNAEAMRDKLIAAGFAGAFIVQVTETPVEPVQPASYVVRVVPAAGLNIRKTPSTEAAIMGVLPENGMYTIVEEQNGWGRLKSGAGWILLKHTSRA